MIGTYTRRASGTSEEAGMVVEDGGGRERQRRRTRRAIVTAAAALLAKGERPSIVDVAEAADVAKRTVYTYFATLEHLLADAALELGRDLAEPLAGTSTDPEERLTAFVRSITRGTAETEHLGRTIIRLTLDAPGNGDDRRRGYRRVAWIEEAIAPVRDRLDPPRFERLVSALATAIGWEAYIVLRDVRGLAPAEIEEVSVWTALAMLRAALADAAAQAPRAGPTTPRRSISSPALRAG